MENLEFMKKKIGGAIGKPELYLAHFLGASEAVRFVKEFRSDPSRDAAKLFPDAAKTNKGVFYAKGEPQSLGEVYKFFSGKMSDKVLRMVPQSKDARKAPAPV